MRFGERFMIFSGIIHERAFAREGVPSPKLGGTGDAMAGSNPARSVPVTAANTWISL
ncbi:MAG: hypothetical protein ACREH8_20395 [Opitutaceae bacterium]